MACNSLCFCFSGEPLRADDSNTRTYCVGIDPSVGGDGALALRGSGALARSSAT